MSLDVIFIIIHIEIETVKIEFDVCDKWPKPKSEN